LGKVKGSVFAVEEDVARRGLREKIPRFVRVISYSDLVEMMEREKVVNFL
jgi:sulfur relay protein TusB/DsrH